jgi:hypothetical protein
MFRLKGRGDGRDSILYCLHKVDGLRGRQIKVASRVPTRFRRDGDQTILVGAEPGVLDMLAGLCTIL